MENGVNARVCVCGGDDKQTAQRICATMAYGDKQLWGIKNGRRNFEMFHRIANTWRICFLLLLRQRQWRECMTKWCRRECVCERAVSAAWLQRSKNSQCDDDTNVDDTLAEWTNSAASKNIYINFNCLSYFLNRTKKRINSPTHCRLFYSTTYARDLYVILAFLSLLFSFCAMPSGENIVSPSSTIYFTRIDDEKFETLSRWARKVDEDYERPTTRFAKTNGHLHRSLLSIICMTRILKIKSISIVWEIN